MINQMQCNMKDALNSVESVKALFNQCEEMKSNCVANLQLKLIFHTLLDASREITELKTNLDESSANYDRLVFALLATTEAREVGLDDSLPASFVPSDEALKVIEAMNGKLREYRILDELPFTVVYPDSDWDSKQLNLKQRIADLESQLENRTEQLTSLQLKLLNSMAEIIATVVGQRR